MKGVAARRRAFLHGLGWTPDPFQLDAMDAIDAGRSVLVAAPTGAGKTLVAEYAVQLVASTGGRAFYTSPIKALSNQKYRDLCAAHGPEAVGLLTGDTVRNPDAPILVMTTEVVRNMLYEQSHSLDGLRWLVLDEVHYLQDPYRGPVWEEVIIHLPHDVGLVCLSATVSNVDEVAGWIREVRGPTDVVVSHDRPVPLRPWLAASDRHGGIRRVPLLDGTSIHPEALSLDGRSTAPGRRGGGRDRPRAPHRNGSRLIPPRREDLVEHLGRDGMLPAIYFIFSRAACDDAANAVARAGLRLVDEQQRDASAEIAAGHLSDFAADDLDALGVDDFLVRLEAGVAAHHAGMVPPFKEIVEDCFTRGLIAVVFATETLALGINMPARSVVIERLQKFGGDRRRMLTPSEFTQLTGRAGRRGMDEVGEAIVGWSPWVRPEATARLAASREFRLQSAFRPTYNMCVNLVRRYDPPSAARVLNQSFAQYQADAAVVSVEHHLGEARRRLAESEARAVCHLGDLAAWVAERRPPSVDTDVVARAARRLRPGSVVDLPADLGARPAVVLSVTERRSGHVRVTCVGRNGRRIQVMPHQWQHVPVERGSVELPSPYQPTSKAFQRAASQALRAVEATGLARLPADSATSEEMTVRSAGGGVETCVDIDDHIRAFEEIPARRREVERLDARLAEESGALARQLEVRLDLLEQWRQVQGWAVTESGRRLCSLYHECDLLVAATIDAGLLDDLDPPGMAAVVSVLAYERRGPGEAPPPWYPSTEVQQRCEAIEHISHELRLAEGGAGLEPTRPADAGLVGIVHGWAAGHDLVDVLSDEDLAGGDFVRSIRLVIDLLGQVADVAPLPTTARTARQAIGALDRGVVEVAGRV